MKDFNLDDDVIDFSINNGLPEFMQGKATVLANTLIDQIGHSLGNNANGVKGLFGDGITCRVMKTDNPQWQQGTLKLTLEFLPDEEL